MDLFYNCLNSVIENVGSALVWVVKLLPENPFKVDLSPYRSFLGFLNWVFPLKEISIVLGAWCSCIAIYYVYSILLRWLKAV